MIFQCMTPALNHRRFEPDEQQQRVGEINTHVNKNIFLNKSQAEYKTFETQVVTQFFSRICNFIEMFIALCFSHNSLTVRPMQTCPLQF